MREESLKGYSTCIRKRQPDEKFTTSRDICQIDLEESYSAPVQKATVTIDSREATQATVETGAPTGLTERPRIAPWKATEDEKLLNLHHKYFDNWKKIEGYFHGRDAKECKDRYTKIKVHGKVKQGRWSKDEVELLMKYHRLFKNNWSHISKMIKTRTPIQIKDKVKEMKKAEAKRTEARKVEVKKNVKFDYLPQQEDNTGCQEYNPRAENNFSSKVKDVLTAEKTGTHLYNL